jgi:Na+-transporting NADH:ubiquinone oxidoreductase subunit E
MHDLSWLVILLSAVFTDNILLSRFLGLCPFAACSKRMDTAIGLGWAVMFVTAVTAAANSLLHQYVLVPLGLEYLELLLFIALIAGVVQLIEMVVERFAPRLYHALGIFLPLITVNCAILGTSLFMINDDLSTTQSLAYGVGSGAGWMLAIGLMAGLRERMIEERIPLAFRGLPVTLILTGLLAMVFRRLTEVFV